MLFVEVVSDNIWPLLSASQLAAHVRDHLGLVRGPASVKCVVLDVIVEQLVGVELGAVVGKVKELNLLNMLGSLNLNQIGPVDGMPVDDHEDLPLGLFHKAVQEVQEHPHPEAVTEDHEAQVSAVCRGRDHVRRKPLLCHRYHRRLPLGAVACPGLMVRSQSHLVTPVSLSTLGLRPGLDRGACFGQPSLDRQRTLLISPSHGLLRCETPAPKVLANGGQRQPLPQPLDDQFLNCFSRPQQKGESQLLGASRLNPPDDLLGLAGGKSGPLALQSSPPVNPKGLFTTAPVGRKPFDHLVAAHSEESGSFGLRHPGLDGPHGLPPKVFLGHTGPRASSSDLHEHNVGPRRKSSTIIVPDK
jgi:hypothetical protein